VSGTGGRFAAFWAALDAVPVESDAEALYDVGSAEGRLRRANLARYLEQSGAGADTLLVAEAPGWRGMTNTGVPFTSMRELGPEYGVPPEPTAPWEASSRVVHAALDGWRGALPVGIEATAVRHPAQGGAKQFTEQLRALDR